jgi:murein DD-endopeptidase MepM/ murein hydrolase activator NlpD
MGTEGTRARSHAHAKRRGRLTVHFVVVTLALLAVTFAARFPGASVASTTPLTPSFSLSGVTGGASAHSAAFFRPGTSIQTRESVAKLTAVSNVASVRAAGGVSPVSAFSAGVSAAAATTGQQGAGVQPLADIVDPRKPFILYQVQEGDTASVLAERFGISLRTLLDNNPTAGSEEDVLQIDQQLVVPRKDGILYKVGHGETVDSIVNQFDNVTAATVVDYRPNAITDPNQLEPGVYLLLPGATVKPPPPPPPAPTPAPAPTNPGGGNSGGSNSGGGGGSPMPGGSGRFSMPLGWYLGVSDPFGTNRGGGTYHTGIDLDLYGANGDPVYAACDGRVTKTEYLTYSYGYHVVIDCGDGFTTLYAHFSRIDVSPGQWVSAGTQLGLSGSTGFSTGEHLHFEIRLNGAPMNPNDYLPFGYGY